MARRGDGIGIEVGSEALRAVRLSFDVPGRLATAAEETIARIGDDDAVLDAFVRVVARLGATDGTPARLAWFPPTGVLRALDVTGVDAAEVRRRVGELHDVTATTTVAAGARQWLVAVTWDGERAGRFAALARRAGLAVTTCEPGPLALARVLPSRAMIARRDGWVTVVADGVPRAALGAAEPSNGPAALRAVELGATDLARLPDDGDAVPLAVDALAGDRFHGREPDVGLVVTGDHYPPYPAGDVRAAARQVVALGAAVAAAGLAGRVRAVEPLLAVADGSADARRPWVVERLADDEPDATTRLSWWRRLLGLLTGNGRRPAA